MSRLAAFLTASLATLGLCLDAPLPGYTVSEITWQVDPFNNGTLYNITGTIEQVHDQIEKINPSYKALVHTPNSGEQSLAAAGDWSARCGPGTLGWERASRDPIYNGIYYLRHVGGQPTQGPGFGSCSRVSCSWQSAIWWCNDNDHQFTLPGFGTIADCAQVLYDECSIFQDRGEFVLGQNFHKDHWNCIVRRDRDNC
ncbi:hypothetical protein V8F20_006005 [Naviculisporaceae sp. PSN 640]